MNKSHKRRTSDAEFRVLELFAGVGGFRVGLEKANEELIKDTSTGLSEKFYKVVWSNQWEPSTIRQHASEVYEAYRRRIGDFKPKGHCDIDIAVAINNDLVPKGADLVVGGFPCQDYSVARTLNQAVGLHGKKGVLWWEIYKILDIYKPKYGLFENVDRLLKSPATQRGRDFAVMLASLANIGYQAEWRVINSADYGFPQRRKRVFILVYQSSLRLAKTAAKTPGKWLTEAGILAKALPCAPRDPDLFSPDHLIHNLQRDCADVTEGFNRGGEMRSPFHDAGMLIGHKICTLQTNPKPVDAPKVLQDVLEPLGNVPDEFFVPEAELPIWKKLKGAKSLERRKPNGVVYTYDEGPIAFPDPLDKPSRTIVTGEGGATPSRFKHIIKQDGRWRRLMPVELERLNGFPDDHTKAPGISDVKRAFFMGNALVTGIVTKIAVELARAVKPHRSGS